MPEDFETDTADSSGPKELREYAERQAREAQEARDALAALQRKDFFRDAGLDPKNPLHTAVMNGYTGELDGTQVAEFVASTGVLSQTSAPAPEPEPSQDEADAHLRIADATRGTESPISPDRIVEIDQQMRDLTERADREGWLPDKYNIEMARLAESKGNPVMIGGMPLTP